MINIVLKPKPRTPIPVLRAKISIFTDIVIENMSPVNGRKSAEFVSYFAICIELSGQYETTQLWSVSISWYATEQSTIITNVISDL